MTKASQRATAKGVRRPPARKGVTSGATKPPTLDQKTGVKLAEFLDGVLDGLGWYVFDAHSRPFRTGREVGAAIAEDWDTAPGISVGDYIDTALSELGIRKPTEGGP